jgi:trehalose synthase
VRQVELEPLAPHRLEALVGPARTEQFQAAAAAARELLAGRRVLNVNSTATGGGVAELLQTLLTYALGVGVKAEWAVIDGNPPFFEVTKRLHNHLYGTPGDGGPLGDAARGPYEATLAENTDGLRSLINPSDIVVLHDPQTAGLAAVAREAGAVVVWRCHVGRDTANPYTDEGWAFLRPYIEAAHAYVFSRAAFIPDWIEPARAVVIPPSIDPFSSKNEELAPDQVRSVLQYAGVLAGDGDPRITFTRRDGSTGRLQRRAHLLDAGPPPDADTPLVVQVSRWDRMKDMPGVLRGFVEHVAGGRDAHLMLVGPDVRGVEDDPEGGAVQAECVEAWRQLPSEVARQVHLVCLPMVDPDEQAVIVNALQRHASVVTQKSLAEGFGLTVTEAMWKRRPMVASRVGGIGDQIRDGVEGLLIEDPEDLAAFGRAVALLLDDDALAASLADAAHQRVFDEYLGDLHLERYGELFAALSGL